MSHAQDRLIRLAGAHNVRDLGGYPTASGATTRWRAFLRGDALHELNAEDVEALLGLGLRTVIDLRNDVEIARQPSVFASEERVRYHHIPIFDGLAPADAMLRDSAGGDLSERYIAAAEACGPAIARVARTIAQADEGVVLFNCTAGKDRTGIVAAMILSLAGVSAEEIARDYAMTSAVAANLMRKLRENALARGVEEAVAARLLASEPASMLAFLRHIEERHGGFRAYLETRAGAEEAAIIERRILADA